MRIAIVTGGGGGLGRAFAEGLAAAGTGVVVADRDRAAAEETAGRLPAPSVAVAADLSDPGEAHRLLAAAQRLGGPHVLVNNAGGWTPGRHQFPAAAAPDWQATVALNLITPMLLSQLVAEPMRRLGGGAVVNVSSSAARGDEPYGSPEYAATKAALIRFTTASAGLHDSHRVRMTCLVPGWIGLPRAHEQVAALPPADRERTPALIPPERVVAAGLDLIDHGRPGAVVELTGGTR